MVLERAMKKFDIDAIQAMSLLAIVFEKELFVDKPENVIIPPDNRPGPTNPPPVLKEQVFNKNAWSAPRDAK